MATQHFVLDVMLFILSAVRYAWGPPTDIFRLGFMLTVGWAIIADMDLYYGWPLSLPSFGAGTREVITKSMLALTLIIDLARDYMNVRFRQQLNGLAKFVKEGNGNF